MNKKLARSNQTQSDLQPSFIRKRDNIAHFATTSPHTQQESRPQKPVVRSPPLHFLFLSQQAKQSRTISFPQESDSDEKQDQQ